LTAFATFWHGPLPGLIRACLASFPAKGAALTLFAYDLGRAPPPGVALRDAREICPDPSLAARYRVGGEPSLATFADRFRYELLARTQFCWVDADIVALRPDAIGGPAIWGRQPRAKGKALINNAVLRLPPGDPVLEDMLARARAAEGRDIGWGAIGPFLLTEIAEAHGADASAAAPERFFPVAPDDFWRLFDPDSRDIVAQAARSADLLHLWSELLRRVGYDFDAAPPRGAYLYELFSEIGALASFARPCGRDEIAAMVARWRASAASGAQT
jgi:hypothetical protein